jgi:hypothetical protein
MTDRPLDDADELGARLIAEGRRSFASGGDRDEYSLPEVLLRWEQWVSEIERGALWVGEELDAACHLRNDLDAALMLLAPSRDRSLLVEFVDRLDRRFERATVLDQSRVGRPGGWWWTRVPRRTDQRLFLRGEWSRN